MASKLIRVINNELCIGCGFCESLGKDFGYSMKLKKNGFYYPVIPKQRNKAIEKKISNICPSINIIGDFSNSEWGALKSVGYSYSTNSEIREKGSSGGIISAICIYLLNKNIVDAVLQVGTDNTHFLYNKMKVSKNAKDILSNSSSRYSPTLIFNEFVQILDSSNEKFAFVGKPCDILALKNFINIHPVYKERIKYFISIVCAGIPSYNATLDILKLSGKDEQPISIKYRGDGWPGVFKAKYKDNSEFIMSYKESWMNYLGRQTHFRCKICPDGVGSLADFSVGDGWESKNGYPDFNEKPGRSFVFTRTTLASDIIEKMICEGLIFFESIKLDELSIIQPYQYRRTLTAGYRIIPMQVLTFGLLKLKNMKLLKKMSKFSLLRGCKDSIGTITRSFNRNEY